MDILTIISPIILAICSGLAFLAYKHPKSFSNISTPLTILLGAVYMLYLAWMLGFQRGFFSADTLNDFEDGLPIGFGLSFIIYLISTIYLSILSKLPKIIGIDDKSSKEDDV
jgi:uncharacterized membrane protein (DUF485 family)